MASTVVPTIYWEDVEYATLTGRTTQALPVFFRSEQIRDFLLGMKSGRLRESLAEMQMTGHTNDITPYLAQLESNVNQMQAGGVPASYVETLWSRGTAAAGVNLGTFAAIHAASRIATTPSWIDKFDPRRAPLWTGPLPAPAPNPGNIDGKFFPPYVGTGGPMSPTPIPPPMTSGPQAPVPTDPNIPNCAGLFGPGWTPVDVSYDGAEHHYECAHVGDQERRLPDGTVTFTADGRDVRPSTSGVPPVVAVDTGDAGGIGGHLPPTPTQTATPGPTSVPLSAPNVGVIPPATGFNPTLLSDEAEPRPQSLPGVTITAQQATPAGNGWLLGLAALALLYVFSQGD